MADGHDVLPQFGVEDPNGTVQVPEGVRENARDRQGRRSVDLDDLAAGEFTGGDHLLDAGSRVQDDPVVLGRISKGDAQDVAVLLDIVGRHGDLLSLSRREAGEKVSQRADHWSVRNRLASFEVVGGTLEDPVRIILNDVFDVVVVGANLGYNL